MKTSLSVLLMALTAGLFFYAGSSWALDENYCREQCYQPAPPAPALTPEPTESEKTCFKICRAGDTKLDLPPGTKLRDRKWKSSWTGYNDCINACPDGDSNCIQKCTPDGMKSCVAACNGDTACGDKCFRNASSAPPAVSTVDGGCDIAAASAACKAKGDNCSFQGSSCTCKKDPETVDGQTCTPTTTYKITTVPSQKECVVGEGKDEKVCAAVEKSKPVPCAAKDGEIAGGKYFAVSNGPCECPKGLSYSERDASLGGPYCGGDLSAFGCPVGQLPRANGKCDCPYGFNMIPWDSGVPKDKQKMTCQCLDDPDQSPAPQWAASRKMAHVNWRGYDYAVCENKKTCEESGLTYANSIVGCTGGKLKIEFEKNTPKRSGNSNGATEDYQDYMWRIKPTASDVK